MSGSCTAWDPLLNRSRIFRLQGSVIQGSRFLPCWGKGVEEGGLARGGRVSLSFSRSPSARASSARWASTSPSIKKSQWDYLTGSCGGDPVGSTALSDDNCDKLTKDTAFLWLLMPLGLWLCRWFARHNRGRVPNSLSGKYPSPDFHVGPPSLPVKLLR